MFFLTYAQIAELGHLYVNINRMYMALMMVAPMALVMLFVMRSMYENATLNLVLYGAFAGLFIVIFSLSRTQTPVGDEQFLRSMIPHHSSAILMCEESSITDPEIVLLCEQIIESQKEEIAQMKDILARY
jgi:uncharacterized protein (DUF305 family)